MNTKTEEFDAGRFLPVMTVWLAFYAIAALGALFWTPTHVPHANIAIAQIQTPAPGAAR